MRGVVWKQNACFSLSRPDKVVINYCMIRGINKILLVIMRKSTSRKLGWEKNAIVARELVRNCAATTGYSRLSASTRRMQTRWWIVVERECIMLWCVVPRRTISIFLCVSVVRLVHSTFPLHHRIVRTKCDVCSRDGRFSAIGLSKYVYKLL